uniref:E3 ubiquitin-protein ligase TRIM7-like isoform X2 n=1 Tax=Pogona vitticeps TaxID=103695 RepID=A0ABM5FHF2_9SAUR
MAAAALQDLCEEATCSICLEDFMDPITIECGHNFCRACLTRCWEVSGGEEVSCPQCREKVQRSLFPNRLLANIVELTKKLRLEEQMRGEGKGGACGKHREPLKLFCKDDEAPICMVCKWSKEHRDHLVVPLEEAAQDYKDLISSRLKLLEEERANILTYKAKTEEESQDLLKQTKAEMEKMKAEFKKLRQFLEDQEKLLMVRMEEVEKEIVRKKHEHLAKLSEELFSLGDLIREMEQKCQQPPEEFLQCLIGVDSLWQKEGQWASSHCDDGTKLPLSVSLFLPKDVGSILQRSDEKVTFQNPVVFLPEVKWKIWDFCDINPFLAAVMNQFKDTLVHGLQLQKANVTLDPDTAHLWLIVSEDRKSVTCGSKRGMVLGQERFTAGRHFWEVVVRSEENWLAGVTRESVERKEDSISTAKEGILAVEKWDGEYTSTSHPTFTCLSPSDDLKRIRVSLNCAAGRVAFYNADTAAHLYTFSEASFVGETFLPLFEVFRKGHVRISP